MHIAEIFYSIQGEGMLVGMPSVFIRTSGCNLRCSFCDTPYASWNPEGESVAPERIVERVARFPTQHVVVTGGEPLIAPEIEELCDRLKALQYHVTVETAATVFKPIQADLMSLSPKLANSIPQDESWRDRHDRDRIRLDVIRRFMERYSCQFKFVLDKPEDIQEVRQLLVNLPALDPERIMLMPQATDAETLAQKGRWIAELCKEAGYRFGPRLHIDLYGLARGT